MWPGGQKHDDQFFLAIYNIDHAKTKVKSPQTNGICERFHKRLLQQFYQLAFRKRLYESIEQLDTSKNPDFGALLR